ncbi:MAG: alpha/beta hydrolase, partial [Microlunatus sp.]|nr:alpha/beta hydrolase [Microlunatus sp.]
MAERSSAREERHLNLGGRLVNIVIEPGPGRPVVMLGGCGVPSYAWDPVTKRLPDRLRVRLDRPGLAGTPWPDRLPTLEEEIATLVELTTRFPGGVLVAHSMASFHAEGVIRTRPDLVAGLVLVDGSVETVARSPVGDGAWLAAARVAERAADIR